MSTLYQISIIFNIFLLPYFIWSIFFDPTKTTILFLQKENKRLLVKNNDDVEDYNRLVKAYHEKQNAIKTIFDDKTRKLLILGSESDNINEAMSASLAAVQRIVAKVNVK